MIGALLPDIFKLSLPLRLFWANAGCACTLPYTDRNATCLRAVRPTFWGGRTRGRAFLLFTLGMLTHYEPDVLLIGVAGGLALLYPFTWETWHFDLIRPNNWFGTTMLVSGAGVL